MQERRYRPGDVLDDYCPRERRITDHAIVAMIDDKILRTRCGICDAEHEYKEGKVPTPRRKTQPPALFNQVLDNVNGSTPKPQPPPPVEQPVAVAAIAAPMIEERVPVAAVAAAAPAVAIAPVPPVATPSAAAVVDTAIDEESPDDNIGNQETPEEGGFRRSLIRATFPRPDGQPQQPQRNAPEFTLQSLHNRRNNNQRHAGGQNKFRGGRRRPGGGTLDNIGPMRFRDHGHGQGQGSGQGQGPGQGNGGGRRRRGGKKNR